MSSLIPIFPLQIVVFPGETVNLHIFEPRYKQLITEAEASGLRFGMPAYVEGEKLKYGTEVELVEVVKKYEDGKMDIKIKGLRTFKVLNFIRRMSGRLYSGADINYLENDKTQEFEKNRIVLALLKRLSEFLKFHKALPADAYSFISYDVAHYIGLSIKQEVELLGIQSETKRLDYIIEHLERIIPVLNELNELEKKVKQNGHFKNLIPPNL